MTLHIVDKFGREVHAKESGGIMIYSVNELLTVIVKKDTPIGKVLAILEQMPDE